MRKSLLLAAGYALIAGGAFAVLWCGYLKLNMARVQREASRAVENARRAGPASAPHVVVIHRPHQGDPIGRIEIPRLKVSAMVLEGAAPEVLRVAVGHINGAALPGARGNVVLAAHRDTLFRPLRAVKPGDEVVVTTAYGKFRYFVDSTEIVDPKDIRVLGPTPDPQLTLVTCYPFSYIGAAPKRFIVHARQQLRDRSAGE